MLYLSMSRFEIRSDHLECSFFVHTNLPPPHSDHTIPHYSFNMHQAFSSKKYSLILFCSNTVSSFTAPTIYIWKRRVPIIPSSYHDRMHYSNIFLIRSRLSSNLYFLPQTNFVSPPGNLTISQSHNFIDKLGFIIVTKQKAQ